MKEVNLLLLAATRVLLKVTLWAELPFACVTYPVFTLDYLDDPFTVLSGTQLQRELILSHVKVVYLYILFFYLFGEVLVEICVLRHDCVAFLLRTEHLLECFYFVCGIVADTALAVYVRAFT
jgi:hypothetical protein